MKLSKIVLLSFIFLLATSLMPQTAPFAPQSLNADRTMRRPKSALRLPTVWDRIRNPREAYRRLILEYSRPSASRRVQPSAADAHAFADAGITNPLFFIPPTYLSGGRLAGDIASGDFNGDSRPDFVVSNQCGDEDCTQGTLGVLLGNGDGTYQPVVLSNSGTRFGSVAVGDFNRDGKLDVAVNSPCLDLGCTTGAANILLGNGDGTFRPAVAYASGGNAFSIEAGDVNGDGKLDLVTVSGPGSAGVLLGNGDGTFRPVLTATTSTSGNSAVFLGDFSGDGQLDLAVVTGECDLTGVCTRSVSVALGNGDGTFAAPVGNQSALGFNPQAVGMGDVNGDGKLDLAVVDACVPSTDSCVNESVETFLGNGDGTFKAPRSSAPLSNDITSIAFIDLNGDSKPDLVTVDPNAALAAIMPGAGDGTFHALGVYETGGTSPTFSGFGDFNGDGRVDLTVANNCADLDCAQGSAIALLGNGDGTFHAPGGYPVSVDSTLQSLAVADFNRDGSPDLAKAVVTFDNTSFPSFSISLLLGQSDGTFVPGASAPVGASAFSGFRALPMVAGDFNQDGKPDLATTACPDQACTALWLIVLPGKGDGTFRAPLFSMPLPLLALAAGDLNGDGKLDLVSAINTCAGPNDFVCSNGFANILLGNGDGTFQAPVNYPFVGSHTGSAAVGDFNRDGKLDFVLANSNCGQFDCPMGSLSVFLGNGDGTFQASADFPSGDFGAYSVAPGDLNGDGKVDLVVSNLGPCFFFPCGSSSIGVLLGNGDGSFQAATIFSPGPSGPPAASREVRSIALADLDGDGNLDLALSTRSVLLGNGDGTFKDAQSYSPGTNAGVSAAVADFNRDGKPDLAVNTAQFTTVLLNISTSFQHGTTTTVASSRNPVDVHRLVTFTATVTSNSEGGPTGTVTFSDGGHALASLSLAKGKAKFSTISLEAGLHAITASYSGDETFLASTSSELIQAVRAGTRTRLTSSRNPSRRGQSVTFTVVILASSGEAPSGAVTFKDSSSLLATVQLSGGRAAFTTSRLRKGAHLIRANYTGSSIDQPSSAILIQRVK